jgi:hypothetical protein
VSYEAEVAKEYLREAFHRGTLDITDSVESVRGFVQIFAGEMEALIAISHCTFLEPDEISALMKIAAPTAESARHYRLWLTRATA